MLELYSVYSINKQKYIVNGKSTRDVRGEFLRESFILARKHPENRVEVTIGMSERFSISVWDEQKNAG